MKLDTVVAGLWFHQLRAGSRSGGHWAAHRHMLVRLQWGIGGALSHPEPRLPTTGPMPRLPARLPRDPVQTLPTTSTPGGGGGRFPGNPPAWGTSSYPLYFLWTLLRQVEPRFPPSGGISSILGLGLLWSPLPLQQLTRPAQGSPSSCRLPFPTLGAMKGLCPQLTCPPAPQFRDNGIHEYLTWEAAYLSLNRENRTLF